MNELQVGIPYYNPADGKMHQVQQKTPEGGYMVQDVNDTTGQSYYLAPTDVQNTQWVPQMPVNGQPVVQNTGQAPNWTPKVAADNALDEAVNTAYNKAGVNDIRQDFAVYVAQWMGKKPIETIYADYVAANAITDPLVLGELSDVTKGYSNKVAGAYPVLMHLRVDYVAKAASTLMDSEHVSAVAYSKYPGYDLMIIGYPDRVREDLTLAGVYIDGLKQTSIPRDMKYSFVEASVKHGVPAPDKAIFEAYINYMNLPAKEAQLIVDTWQRSEDLTLVDALRGYCAEKLSYMEKELPMTVDQYDLSHMKENEYNSGDKMYETEEGPIPQSEKSMIQISAGRKEAASLSRIYSQYMNGTFGVFSAFKTGEGGNSKGLNKQLSREMKDLLWHTLSLGFVGTDGLYIPENTPLEKIEMEDSVWVPNISQEATNALADFFNQETYIWGAYGRWTEFYTNGGAKVTGKEFRVTLNPEAGVGYTKVVNRYIQMVKDETVDTQL